MEREPPRSKAGDQGRGAADSRARSASRPADIIRYTHPGLADVGALPRRGACERYAENAARLAHTPTPSRQSGLVQHACGWNDGFWERRNKRRHNPGAFVATDDPARLPPFSKSRPRFVRCVLAPRDQPRTQPTLRRAQLPSNTIRGLRHVGPNNEGPPLSTQPLGRGG